VEYSTVVAACNLVGGQDELVFDGSSVIAGNGGTILARAASFDEDLVSADVDLNGVLAPRRRSTDRDAATAGAYETIPLPPLPRRKSRPDLPESIRAPLEPIAEAYRALVLGTRDYVRKNGFEKVVLGLSGGVDSALVAAIAVDALGRENVVCVWMPSRHSSEESERDAAALAANLGVRLERIPIEPAYEAYRTMLADYLPGAEASAADENLQSRARGNVLMALSNRFGWLVLTTGNKSELAVGYATIYGDMAGGFAVIKDVPKGWVYRLCRHRNARGAPVIPESVLAKPPSAELRPKQRDTDTLPDYGVLDPILAAYIEDEMRPAEIVALGHDEATVRRVIAMVDRNEYKRRQAPPGPKITSKAFGKDRRLPITNRFSPPR
jgi:NAD+ synthase (glutamine-hydrolysing)